MSRSNRTAGMLALVALVMVSLSFAAVPFYRWFCQVTGFAGTTSVAEAAPETVAEEMVTVRFDASLERDMPWTFRPQQVEMRIRIGETGLAFYEAHNPTDRPVAGQATFNVTPDQAGGYFTKIACFCFEEQVLQPGETVLMPVTFFVDPEILKNPEASLIHEITLSYTFFEIPLPEAQAALEPAAAKPVN
jgi:cytochrome c oxidase assembly protein subunit 11